MTFEKRWRILMMSGSLLAVGACDLLPDELTIVNGTKQPVANVSVSNGAKSWQIGTLQPGQRHRFRGYFAAEGAAKIHWAYRGERRLEQSCYFTSGMQAKGTIVIAGKELRYECR